VIRSSFRFRSEIGSSATDMHAGGGVIVEPFHPTFLTLAQDVLAHGKP
jgi:hypothetical protein